MLLQLYQSIILEGSDATGCRFSDIPKIWSLTYSYLGGCSNKLMSKLCYINFCVVSQLTLFSRAVSFLFCDALTSRRQGQPAAESTMPPCTYRERLRELQQGVWTSCAHVVICLCHIVWFMLVAELAYSWAASYSIGNRFIRWQIEYCVNVHNKSN